MKKVLNLLLAMFAVCGISCEPNDLVSGKTTFAITVSNITTTSATIDVVPSNNQTYYYFDVVQKIYFEEYATPTEFAYSRIEQRKEYAESQGVALAEVLILGADNYECNWLTGDEEYYAYAFGITLDGELCTDVEVKPFKTLPYSDAPSENTFNIKVSDITARDAMVEVIPSNSDSYYFYVVEKAEYDKYKSESAFAESIAAAVVALHSSLTLELSSGVDSKVFTTLLKPDTDYYAYAFGMSGNGAPTTGVTKVPFKTLEATSNDMVIDYFTVAYATREEGLYAEGVSTWRIALMLGLRNMLCIEVQVPETTTSFAGEYEFTSTFAPGTAVAGSITGDAEIGSIWFVYDDFNNLVIHKCLSLGNVSISQKGDNYTITIEALDQNYEKLTVKYTGAIGRL